VLVQFGTNINIGSLDSVEEHFYKRWGGRGGRSENERIELSLYA
jgi:hypothetical protein